MQDLDDRGQTFPRDRARHLRQRQMYGRERHAQAGRGQHHHGLRRATCLGEELGMAGEGDAGVVDNALVHRSGDERVELSASAAVNGGFQRFDNIGSVRGLQPPRNHGTGGLERLHEYTRARRRAPLPFAGGERQTQKPCTLFQQGGIGDQYQRAVHRALRQLEAQFRPDAGGFAGRQRNDGVVGFIGHRTDKEPRGIRNPRIAESFRICL